MVVVAAALVLVLVLGQHPVCGCRCGGGGRPPGPGTTGGDCGGGGANPPLEGEGLSPRSSPASVATKTSEPRSRDNTRCNTMMIEAVGVQQL